MVISHSSDASEHSRREQILALLEKRQGWCSGELMAEQLGISRAAVAKHVTMLRTSGHGIESAPRRGYRLIVKADNLTAQEVQRRLSTHTFGKGEWRCFDRTTSTNQQGIIWAAEGAQAGSVVLAERQTEGRGRRGRHWFSAPRGIQCSIIVRPSLQEEQIPLLTVLTTVAVTLAIRHSAPLVPRIKAPNDVLLNGRKVCGVLVETGLRATEVEWAVLGIGCNVNAVREDFAEDLQASASSLFFENRQPIPRAVLLARILEQVEFWHDRLQAGEYSGLHKKWEELGGNPF